MYKQKKSHRSTQKRCNSSTTSSSSKSHSTRVISHLSSHTSGNRSSYTRTSQSTTTIQYTRGLATPSSKSNPVEGSTRSISQSTKRKPVSIADIRKQVSIAKARVRQTKSLGGGGGPTKKTIPNPMPVAPTTQPHEQSFIALRDHGIRKSLKQRLFRTNWYMQPVEGIADTPTALGYLPEQYSIARQYVHPDDPTIPQGAKVEQRAFGKLKDSEKLQAMRDLKLSTPPPSDTSISFYKGLAVVDGCPYHYLNLHPTEAKAFNNPSLMVTAFSLEQIPKIRHGISDAEIVFVGRSNVGKSSLINSLTRSNIAKAGKTPGKTQSLNFYSLHCDALSIHRKTSNRLANAIAINHDSIHRFMSQVDDKLKIPLTKTQQKSMSDVYRKVGTNPSLTLVDLPGYGYAKVPVDVADTWNVLIGAYLRIRSPLNFPLNKEDPAAIERFLTSIKELNISKSRFKDMERQEYVNPTSGKVKSKYVAMVKYEKQIELEIAQMKARLVRMRRGDATGPISLNDYHDNDDDDDGDEENNRSESSDGGELRHHPSSAVSGSNTKEHGSVERSRLQHMRDASDQDIDDRIGHDHSTSSEQGDIDDASNTTLSFDPQSYSKLSKQQQSDMISIQQSVIDEHSPSDTSNHAYSHNTEQSEQSDDDYDAAHSEYSADSLREKQRKSGYPKYYGNPLCSMVPPTPHLTFRHGSPVKNIVVLLDSRVGITKFDIQFINFLESFSFPHQIVLTKIDQLRQTELEGVAYSISQSLFPHEFVKMLEKSQPIPEDYYPGGRAPKNAPSFLIRSNEQDKLWDLATNTKPRKFCNPLIIGVSTTSGIGIETLRKSLMHSIVTQM